MIHARISLASVGDPIPSQHIDVILESGPQDYGSVISVDSKFEMIEFEGVKALHIAHEMCLSKYNKKIQLDVASINL